MSIDTDLQAMLQDDATRLSAADRVVMLAQALKELSSDYPREVTRDFTGDGDRAYALVDSSTAVPAESALFSEWARGLSRVRGVYQEVDSNWLPLDLEAWEETEYKFGTTTEEWLPALVFTEAIDSSTTFRVRFTIEWTEADNELGGRVYAAVVELAAAYCHEAMAANYSTLTDAVLDADSVDQGSLAGKHMDLHDLHRRNYRKLMGLQQAEGKGAAASSPAVSLQKDLVDFTPSWPGGVSLRRRYNR